MATQDDDDLARIPEPETAPTAAELARARRFAEIVDKTLSGRTPPAISADHRALLEVATVIRAAHGGLELPPGKQRSVVEDALRQAIGSSAMPMTSAPTASTASTAPIAPGRGNRWAPWVVAGTTTLVAAAAVAMLWLRGPDGGGGRVIDVRTAPRAAVPEEWTSRPADAVVGPITHDHAGDASARIDAIFADRLDGFRSQRMARGARR
jgi:hypothetical protein